ncbi:MAG: sugar phosphate nucleotidyltransferase [Polyangiaceae bacterium]
MAVFALILAGGSGTRFWPASRARLPKQLLPLAGEAPLIDTTIQRVLGRVGGWDRVYIASSRTVGAATRVALPALPERNLLVEPSPRNTAPCIAWATAVVARRDPDAVLLVLPSDHFVSNTAAFDAAVDEAVRVARTGRIVTLGITPTRPETGFGYIEVGAPLDPPSPPGAGGGARSHFVERFVEKPSRDVAERYVASGKFLWNAGMFVFRAADMRAAVAAHLPSIATALDEFDRAAELGGEQAAVDARFGELPSVSIDVGVMEKVGGLAVVPVDMGWSDIGSWEAAWELAPRDADENATKGDVVIVEGRRNLVHDLRSGAGKRTIALLGVDDLVVVETDDALLVCPRDRAQDVRLIVDRLNATGRADQT